MKESSSKPVLWILLLLGLSIFVCAVAVAGGASFFMLRTGSNPVAESAPVESVLEQVEVTREVVVEVEVTREVVLEVTREVEVNMAVDSPTAVPQPTDAPPTPTPQPTAVADPPEEARDEEIDLDLFYEAWEILRRDFDGEMPSEEEMLYAIINGSIGSLEDDYTRFIPPDIAARLREDMGGSVQGIGAFVRETEDGFVEIVRPLSGQPAELVGLQAGDLIIGVDGESVVGQTLDEVLLKVRGPEGTVVNLTILRDREEELEFTITRTRFEVPIIEAKMLTDTIGYIHLTEFNANAETRLIEAFNDLLAQGATSLVFDLRDNPGGFLNQSVAVADLFLPESVVLLERNNKGLSETFMADSGDPAEDFPLVVLVNAGSASASEIVAGALRDNGRAVLIGETTFGKGSVQQLHTLSNGAELRVTIARWYTPANVSISDEGIAPDIEVPAPDSFELGGEDDVQLQRAIEYLQTGQ
jgi:carboxyl-terminal processing protease